MKETILQLNWLEIIFIILGLASLFMNGYQLLLSRREKAEIYRPLENGLVGLFNDVKGKTNNILLAQNAIFHNANPHKEIATLKWEYYHFAQSVIAALNGFKETVVSMLVTIDPSDPTGNRSFNATEYGLSDHEKLVVKNIHERQIQEQFSPPEPARKS